MRTKKKSILILVVALSLLVVGVLLISSDKKSGSETSFSLTGSSPKNEDTDFDSRANIELTFSKNLDEDTISGAEISFSPQVGFETSVVANKLIINPHAPLANKQYYRLNISGLLKDDDKNGTLVFRALDTSEQGKIINKLPISNNDYRIEYVEYGDSFLVTIFGSPYDSAKASANKKLDELGVKDSEYKVIFDEVPTSNGPGAPASNFEPYD